MTAPDRPLVAVLDYGIGNLRSAQKALERVGADARLTADVGVDRRRRRRGAARRRRVRAVHGVAARRRASSRSAHDAIGSGRPFLGICVGMQMLFAGSDETPGVAGLGRFPGMIRRLPDGVKRPQMQWNRLHVRRPSPALRRARRRAVGLLRALLRRRGLPTPPWPPATTAATSWPLVADANVVAMQFHPEKSGANGLAMLGNWVADLA